MVRMRAYRLRFYPTSEQEAELVRWFGAARWVWNHCLEYRTKAYQLRGEKVTGVDFSRELTRLKRLDSYAWLRAVPRTVLTEKLRDQDQAFRAFFAGRARYPKFRSKRRRAQSVRLQIDQRVARRYFDAGRGLLRLPRLGVLRVVWSRKPAGVPKMVTVRRDGAGRWWVSFMVEEAVPVLPITTGAVGIDRGLKALMVCSDGTRVANPGYLARHLRRLRRMQRCLSRRQKGSRRWEAQRQRVARLHARVGDARHDFLHKVTTRLVHENQVLCVEDLNVKGMLGNGSLARHIADVAWAEFARMLYYKAEWYGRTLIEVDRWFPSSKRCSACGHVLDELRLDQRVWRCPKCGAEHDRDLNAAKNILNEGLRTLVPRGAGELTRVERGGGSWDGTTVLAVALDEARTAQSVPDGWEPDGKD